MKVLRILVDAVVIGAAAVAIFELCIVPYRCNGLEKATRVQTLQSFGETPSPRSAKATRELTVQLEKCVCVAPDRPNLFMILAANYRILERREEALDAYQRAAALHRRPQIYFNTGVVLLETGRTNEAIEEFTKAALFDPEMAWKIPGDPSLTAEVYRRVQLYLKEPRS